MTYRSRPLLDLARGRACKVRLDTVCNGDSETTISAHYPVALGTSYKQPDWRVAWCCSSCHDVIDGRVPSPYSRDYLLRRWEQGHIETMGEIFECGLIQITGNLQRKKTTPRLTKILPRRA